MTIPKAQALGPLGAIALTGTTSELVLWIPDLSESLAGLPVDGGQFKEWLEGPLSIYLLGVNVREAMAQRAAVIRWIEGAAADPAAAVADGRLRRLPAWFAEPAVAYAAHQLGHDWPAALKRGDVQAVAAVLRRACESLRRQKSSRGRPKQLARDKLLFNIIEKLKSYGVSAADAADRAGLILERCGAPRLEHSIERAARRGRRGSISV